MEGLCRATPAEPASEDITKIKIAKEKIACDDDDISFFQKQIFDISGDSKIDKKDCELAKLKESFRHKLKQET